MVDLARRGLFRGKTATPKPQQRMPWQVAENIFTNNCSRCMACVDKCPEKIVISGDGGFPTIDFQRGECSYCKQCADICPEQVFDLTQALPWQQTASLHDNCLPNQGVMCRSCEDNCEPEAINFKPVAGGISEPVIDSQLCNGCGGCIASCPVNAISMSSTAN